jgi:dolichol-phosphate mannosyltransferase
MKPDVSVVVPFFNEADNMQPLLSAFDDFFKENTLAAEVIFVDDGSTDESLNIICHFSPLYFTGKVIKLSRNYGSHAAIRAGIIQAKGQYITFVFADLQDPLLLIKQLYECCIKGNEIAWAVRKSTATGFFHTLFSKLYAYLMRKFVSPAYPQNGFDVVLFSSKVQNNLNQHPEANSSIFLQILTLGFKQEFIHYTRQSRQRGNTKWTIAKKVKLFVDSFIAFSFAPIRMVTVAGIAMFILGFLWMVYIITRKILVNDLEAGWPALVSILMIGFGITNISLGIIAEYLWRTLDASRKRPIYIVDEVIALPAPVQKFANE